MPDTSTNHLLVGGWGGVHWLMSDPDGGFSIPIEEAGSFHLAAARCGFGTAMSGPIELELGKDAEVGDLVLVGPGQIEGVVVYPDGQPVQEIEVQAFFDPAIEEVRRPSLIGGLQSDFLRESGGLRLSAANAEGEPVGGVFACFEDRSDPIIRHYERERSETGEYVFAVPPGEWELTVYDWLEGGGRAYVPAELDRVVVVSGEESELRITLRSGGYLGLVLHLPSAETELSGLAITAHPLDGGEPLELRSFLTREGDEWAFIDRIEPEVAYRRESMLARGSYRLEVRADGLGAADVAFAIETGKTSDVEVWLTPTD